MSGRSAAREKRREVTATLLAALALAAFYFSTQFATSRIIANDGHFHIRYSQLLLERGFPDHLPELRYTIWNDAYRDHQFLFHALLVPFSLLPDITIGAKASAALFATIAGLAFFWALTVLRARSRWFWLVLFAAGSAGFLFRIQLPRVQSLALALLLVVIIALLTRRTILLFAAAFINVWLYDSFLLLGAVGLAWIASVRIASDRWEIKPVIVLLLGLSAGIVINPFFPQNFASSWFHIQRILAPIAGVPLPSEWQSEPTVSLLINNAPIVIVALGLAFLAISARRKEPPLRAGQRTEPLFFLILALFFLALLFCSRRFIEYAPPIILLLLAVIHRDRWPAVVPRHRRWCAFAAAGVAVVGGTMNTIGFIRETQTDATYRCCMDAGIWIDRNVPKGELVFTTDWDDFPPLYFNAPDVRYAVGMDPLLTIRHDPELWRLYAGVTLGEHQGPYAPIIADRFDARYVFSDAWHGPFIEKFDQEPGVYRVFTQRECRIYEIRR